MKILQVNCVYNEGSTGKIIAELHKGLIKDGYESLVVYGRGSRSTDSGVIKISSETRSHFYKAITMITGLMYGSCIGTTYRLIKIIRKEKPDVVHLHCINGNFINIYWLINWLKENDIKTVLTLHAEFIHTANCGHALDCERWKNGCGKCPRRIQETGSLFFDNTHKSWEKMRKSFDGFEKIVVVAVSPWLSERAQLSPILSGKEHKVVLNGIDTSVFKYYSNDKNQTQKTEEKLIFHATPTFTNTDDDLKGGKNIIKLAKKLEKYSFVVAGRVSMEEELPSNIITLGKVTDQVKLAKYYSQANATVLVSKRETFSMVTAESLCCGTPVVGYKAGAPEQIAMKEYCDFVEQGDIKALQDALVKRVNEQVDKEKISRDAKAKYSTERMIKEYELCYKELSK